MNDTHHAGTQLGVARGRHYCHEAELWTIGTGGHPRLAEAEVPDLFGKDATDTVQQALHAARCAEVDALVRLMAAAPAFERTLLSIASGSTDDMSREAARCALLVPAMQALSDAMAARSANPHEWPFAAMQSDGTWQMFRTCPHISREMEWVTDGGDQGMTVIITVEHPRWDLSLVRF